MLNHKVHDTGIPYADRQALSRNISDLTQSDNNTDTSFGTCSLRVEVGAALMSVAGPQEALLQGYLHKQVHLILLLLMLLLLSAPTHSIEYAQSRHLKLWKVRYFLLTRVRPSLHVRSPIAFHATLC